MNPQGEDSVRLDCQTEPGNRISQPLVLIIAATPLNMIVGYSTRVSPMLAEPHYPGSVPPTPQPQLMLLSLLLSVPRSTDSPQHQQTRSPPRSSPKIFTTLHCNIICLLSLTVVTESVFHSCQDTVTD